MSRFNTLLNFIKHRNHSRKWDSFHSPYLFKFFTYCCNEENNFPEFGEIEKKRHKFLHSKDKISRSDYGAGPSLSSSSSLVSISTIAKASLSIPFQCRFLYRLMKISQPVTILEFGTSLGISTSYLASAIPESKITTVEGDPVLASMAQELFKQLGLNNINIINSTFEEFIKHELQDIKFIDFVFLDGNHKGERLNFYFNELLPHFNARTIVMIDDIYWSNDMHEGWIKLIERPEVTQSVDCFQFGLLFFNKDFLSKENHKIRLPVKAFYG